MSEFIGSRISLVSRSDIRYVGTLHEINSETSTVALENVSSFGTEGRKGNPDEEIPPSDSVYEYIVFRGSDVKDLKIEEAPAVKENKPQQVPNDPAILGSGSRPTQTQVPAPAPRPNLQQQGPSAPPGPPQFPQHTPFNQHFYPPPPNQWGRGGPIPGPPYSGMPYGAPPNWYPPHGPGFPHGGPFPYGGYPPGPSGQNYPQQQKSAPIGVSTKQQAPGELSADKPVDTKGATKATTQVPDVSQASSTTPPVVLNASSNEAKGTTSASQQPASAATTPSAVKIAKAGSKFAPTGPKSGRIVPVVPLPSPVPAKILLEKNSDVAAKASNAPLNTATNRAAIDDATQAATAAVAAAMAKLPPLGGQQTNGNAAVDNITKKVKEMKTTDPVRGTRQPGGGHRGCGRGGHSHETTKFEVPATDFDFESSNAKFNKHDLVKEAVTSSPLVETPPPGQEDAGSVLTPSSGTYDKKSSFFDDLSSEIKDRTDGADKPGGRVWRGEEQKKNLETFGQGSVDNGYRGGYRGRGRGRGGHRGRGYVGNGQPSIRGGRNGYRGGRGESQTVSQ